MDTCHECVNIVEKLNAEFSELQDKYDKLVEKQKDFDYYKDYHTIMSKLSKYFYNESDMYFGDVVEYINSLDENLKEKSLKIVIEQLIDEDHKINIIKIWNEKELMDFYKSINLIGDINKCDEDYDPGDYEVFIYKLPWDKTKYIIEDYR